MVEVGTSDVGTGVVLCQYAAAGHKLHLYALFTIFLHQLTPAASNYDIGNQELLAIKLALEEWRHWFKANLP